MPEALTKIDEVFPDQGGRDAEDELARTQNALLDDGLELTIEPEVPPVGRSWAYDFKNGTFLKAGHGPLTTRREATLKTWVEKCIRTHRGAHPIHPDGYGLEQPLEDFLSHPELTTHELEEAIVDALTFHPQITAVKNMVIQTGDTIEGDAAVEIAFTVVQNDETDITFKTTLSTGEEPI